MNFPLSKKHISIVLVIALIAGCIGLIKSNKEEIYLGHFYEEIFPFFESIDHKTQANEYYDEIFASKFSGLSLPYQWLRKPENLQSAFGSIKSIGFDKFIAKEQYFSKDSSWCCNNAWDKKSPNDIVKGFLSSDTNIIEGNTYYPLFWKRRKKENNLTVVYQTLKEIDAFYNRGQVSSSSRKNEIIENLLSYDLRLLHSDSLSYSSTALEYFNYLKSIKLEYSAYKLIYHNERISFTAKTKESLLHTLKFDTIPKIEWSSNIVNYDNNDGWIKGSKGYFDPQKRYGP